MEKLFESVLGMSLTGSAVILAVLLARLLLRKAPKVFSYALWAVVLFRLLCPFTIESAFSLVPSVQARPGRQGETVIHVQTGITAVNSTVNDFLEEHPYQEGQPAMTGGSPEENLAPVINQLGPAPDWRTLPAVVWLAGAAALLGYGALSLLRLRRRLVGWVPLAGEKNVRLADHIPSPFVLGLVRPVIYLPSALPEGERDYILLHERTHIRRLDYVSRALAWLAVAAHWFNPLVWLAFRLAGRDMEMSCDEAVLRRMGRDVRADYSASLLRLSAGERLPAGPLAFGGGELKGRIKNVLNYKKPAFWAAALALAAVVCAAAALATNRGPALYIDPDAVVSYTAVGSDSYTRAPEHVSTEADRQKDLSDPAKRRPLSKEDGDELVRLVNSYRKSVYGHGELTLSGSEHNLVRMDCADGGYYLLDYWYWNGFSFNPFHAGEDSYTTLVTYYDASGKAGTTWQMEYDFDRAYKDWQQGVPGVNPAPDSTGADLTFTMAQSEDGRSYVCIDGTVQGHALTETAVWWPDGGDALFWGEADRHLTMSYPLENYVTRVHAWWADGSRTSVALSTQASTIVLSSIVDWWEFTVDLSGEQGVVTSMEPGGQQPQGVAFVPEAVTDEDAVKLARAAAKLLTAAEDYYNSYDGPIPSPPARAAQYAPEYGAGELGECLIGGLGDAYVEWHSGQGGWSGLDWLYFAKDPAFFCPRLAGEAAEGSAEWADKDRASVRVNFNVNDARVVSGTIAGFKIEFTVDLDQMAVTDTFTRSMVEGETLELTEDEMLYAARTFAELLRGAEKYFYDAPASSAQPSDGLPEGLDYTLVAGPQDAPDDPERWYLVAGLAEEDLWLFTRDRGAETLLVWKGSSQVFPYRAYCAGYTARMPQLQALDSGRACAAITHLFQGGTDQMYQLTVYGMASGPEMTACVHDWEALMDDFNQTATVRFDPIGHAAALSYRGHNARLEYDLEQWEAVQQNHASPQVYDTDFSYSFNADGTANLDMAVWTDPSFAPAYTARWTVRFTGDGFETTGFQFVEGYY